MAHTSQIINSIFFRLFELLLSRIHGCQKPNMLLVFVCQSPTATDNHEILLQCLAEALRRRHHGAELLILTFDLALKALAILYQFGSQLLHLRFEALKVIVKVTLETSFDVFLRA